jgi:hypothetical protein
MSDERKPRRPRHDEEILSAYRRQVGLQVYLPLGLFTAALVAVVALLWVNGVGDTSTWADAALILVLIPTLVLGLILLAVLVALTVLIGKLIGIIPEPAYQVQTFMRTVEKQVKRAADLVLQPMVTLSSLVSSLREFVNSLVSFLGIK